MSRGRGEDDGPTMHIDPIACDAHRLCIELFPERLRADDWGYPIIDPRPIPPELLDHARRAVTACPTVALRLEQARRGRG
jgi:ferredoxin